MSVQSKFIARGLTARGEAQRNREYFSAADICDELDTMLRTAEADFD